MSSKKIMTVNSPIGKQEVDTAGSPVGVVRMDVDKSYGNFGNLLKEYIDNSSQDAWDKIMAGIDYTYENLDLALAPLEGETGFIKEIKLRLGKGQKLLFKPNLVTPNTIHPEFHNIGLGSAACTEWAFIAALMRWFHDRAGVSYYQMCVGEASTAMTMMANQFSKTYSPGKPITPEAVIEGKSGDFHGGWGFYFARKYLAESLSPGSTDDPMKGYEESINGTYIPPGDTDDRLMVYDLNRIYDDTSKGRDVEVPGGINYKSIIIHKAIVGGDPDDPGDIKAYPGCILVNVPRFKIHAFALFTNVIKNLGIGLYPMQSSREGGYNWDYSAPHNLNTGQKSEVPHTIWHPEMDHENCSPKRDESGNIIVKKTGGITATMIDIIKAVSGQDIFMFHVVDGIEAVNNDHTGSGRGTSVPEGLVFAGLDPVAVDLLCARYMFSNVPMKEALDAGLDDGAGGRFARTVPVPTVKDGSIIPETGYDCPLSRDVCFENAEKRGLGKRSYYIIGRDAVTGNPLVSIQGHPGTVNNNEFTDLVTETLYFASSKFPWDMQQTSFSYLAAVDGLTGSSLKKEFIEAFDENLDGIVTYDEFGKNGGAAILFLYGFGDVLSRLSSDEFGYIREMFIMMAAMLKCSDPLWNSQGMNLIKEYSYGFICMAAYQMSLMDFEGEDPFLPGLKWGNGKWPSFEFAKFFYLGMNMYGPQFPIKVDTAGLYGSAFRYADMTRNNGKYAGKAGSLPTPGAIDKYFSDVSSGKMNPLDFTFYIPAGFDSVGGLSVPNVEVTDDPVKIFTASFTGEKEIWRHRGLS